MILNFQLLVKRVKIIIKSKYKNLSNVTFIYIYIRAFCINTIAHLILKKYYDRIQNFVR